MLSVETIYRETVRPLPVDQQIRLAELIMEQAKSDQNSISGKASALEYLRAIRPRTAKRSAAEIDDLIRKERGSWED